MFMPNMYINPMQRVGYSSRMPAPPQQAIEYYSQMTDEDFPVDYSLACSNSCGCRTYCVVMWWVPCNCMCKFGFLYQILINFLIINVDLGPPPCPQPTAAPQ